jgi:hypothetical protein
VSFQACPLIVDVLVKLRGLGADNADIATSFRRMILKISVVQDNLRASFDSGQVRGKEPTRDTIPFL